MPANKNTLDMAEEIVTWGIRLVIRRIDTSINNHKFLCEIVYNDNGDCILSNSAETIEKAVMATLQQYKKWRM